MSAKKLHGQDIARAVFRWHRWLVSEAHRRERAELRRLSEPLDACYCEGYHALVARVEAETSVDHNTRIKLCYLAALLAHVERHDSERTVSQAMAASKSGSPRVSRLRFRRILDRTELADLYPTLQRMLKLLEKKADLQDLTHSILNWNGNTRRSWAFRYYDALSAKTGTSSS